MLMHGIQDVERTTPHVNIFEIVIGKFISSENISRRNVLSIGHVIVNIGKNSSHWPQV